MDTPNHDWSGANQIDTRPGDPGMLEKPIISLIVYIASPSRLAQVAIDRVVEFPGLAAARTLRRGRRRGEMKRQRLRSHPRGWPLALDRLWITSSIMGTLQARHHT